MKSHMHLQYLLLLLMLPLCSSTDTITPNQPLRDGDLLVSKQSRFALGFFSPRNSTLRYIGVWYNTIREQTVVWVLNRDHPINDSSGVLSINTSGNLLLHRGNTHVWSTNVSISSANATVAQLLDTGNLVLIQNDGNRVVWQGFDYPTDSLIPHMKLGLDRRTGFNRFLTSWKSPTDPGTGKNSLTINASGSPQFFLYQGSKPLWRSGNWNGFRWSGVPTMMHGTIVNVSFLNNQDEISYMYSLINVWLPTTLTIDVDGYIQRNSWLETEGKWINSWTVPTDRCDRYGRCGLNGNCDNSRAEFECTCLAGFEPKSPRDWSLKDGSAGCLRKEGAKVCGNGEGFVKVEGAKPPDTSVARVNTNMSLEACREGCLKECSCSGYAAANVSGSGSGCLSWHGDLVDTRVFPEGGQDLYVRVDAITLAENQKQSKGFLAKKGMMAVLVVGATVIMVLLVSTFWFLRKKMKGRGRQNKMLYNSRLGATWLQDSPGAKEHDESTTNSELQFFDLNTIAAATNNFSSENELGRGGFGSVYKGQLSNGQEIAVKKLSKDSGQGKEEFKNEATLIAKLQHVNLVRLLGCCITEEEKMLVYEYLPNKSLDSFIFDETKKSLLDWRKRFEIIVGIARGILYLHEDSRLRIIHRDLKASNVLLDAEMFPKISDFGLARIFRGNQMEGNTNRVVGTYGYMSPEYAMEGLFSTKSDVYSFGVLLLEIITGRKNSTYYQDNPSMSLIGNVWNLWEEDKALDLIDPSLEKSYPADEVLRCIQIGLLCVQESITDRPTMLTIIFMLGNNSALSFPKRPAFISKTTHKGEDLSCSGEGLLSVNNVTMTVLQPR
ncbi:G-type lectin S-receptor-like serine/threonine-protein kinase RKS1 [Vitis vinifera]|uniref:G-type lectin S-receptor-like serine/threonine-protein kinase RKS1 n=1 Tax=Vitis vinifera TaxID=29760 RepID=UPI0028832EC5|nr:G-type lectin S-receptor-like serine/threonine-protein kinase RKS1 [Vitis vinifera]XP_059596394.1 G-type lectin S-receptor-like serine/threonine-protein kinase RKS1 [Vitis vinifera]